MPVNLDHAVRVSKDVAMDVINEIKRLCFGGALLHTPFLKSVYFPNMLSFRKNDFSDLLPSYSKSSPHRN